MEAQRPLDVLRVEGVGADGHRFRSLAGDEEDLARAYQRYRNGTRDVSGRARRLRSRRAHPGRTLRHRLLRSRWAWWYLLTPPISAVAGSIVALGARSGMLQVGTEGQTFDAQAPLALLVAFVSGLFARAALERLERLLPRPERTDSTVTIISVEPSNVDARAITPTFTIKGSGVFAPTARCASATWTPLPSPSTWAC
jgi:hypothetical protein